MALLTRVLWMVAPMMAVTSVAAEELSSFVAAQEGAQSCWSRQYSAEHLAAHPNQLVTAMRFTIRFDEIVNDNPDFYSFRLEADLRGGQSGRALGYCSEFERQVSCSVECDGGGVAVSHAADGKVLLDLTKHGYIRMADSCGSGELEGFGLEAGPDDKQFLLSPVTGKGCKPLGRPD
ncbi:MAG: hypothetical protein WBA73_14515 [Devosia sp.]